MANYLTPNLSKSNMFYKDLFYDPGQNKVRVTLIRIYDLPIVKIICMTQFMIWVKMIYL